METFNFNTNVMIACLMSSMITHETCQYQYGLWSACRAPGHYPWSL